MLAGMPLVTQPERAATADQHAMRRWCDMVQGAGRAAFFLFFRRRRLPNDPRQIFPFRVFLSPLPMLTLNGSRLGDSYSYACRGAS